MFRCVYPNCSYRTNSSTEIGYHVSRSHFGVTSKPIDCPKCKMAFQTFRSFVVHSHLEHKEIPPNIEEYDHFLIKPKCEPVQCQVCGKSFYSMHSLGDHMRRAHSDPEMAILLCTECGTSFATEEGLKNHKELTHDPKTLNCELCPIPKKGVEKKLYNKKSLHIHKLASHVNKNRNACPKCDFAVASLNKLADHFRVKHLNYLQFKCVQCGNQFTTATNARLHIQQVHEKNMSRTVDQEFFKENRGLYVNLKDIDPNFPTTSIVYKMIDDLKRQNI